MAIGCNIWMICLNSNFFYYGLNCMHSPFSVKTYGYLNHTHTKCNILGLRKGKLNIVINGKDIP